MDLIAPVIKKVDKNYVISKKSEEKLILLDNDGQTTLQRPSFFSLKSYHYYLVNTENTASYKGHLCSIHLRSGIVNIHVKYGVKCQPKDAELLVKSVSKYNDTDKFPNVLIQSIVEQYNKSDDLTNGFYEKRVIVAEKISKQLSESGLTTTFVELQLEGSNDSPHSMELAMSVFKVSLLGTIPKVSMGLKATLVTTKGSEVLALQHKIKKEVYEEEILRIVRRYIAENITAEDLLDKLNGAIRTNVKKAINNYLAQSGRELEDITLSVHKQGSLEPLVVSTNSYLETRILNSHLPVLIKYRCELVPDPALHARVLLFAANNNEIEEILKDQVRNFFASQVDANLYVDELNSTVTSSLAEVINSKLSGWGRKVGILTLQSEVKIPMDVEINHDTQCTTKDGATLTVKNTLLLRRMPGSRKAFETMQIADYTAWGKMQLDRIIKKFAINNNYNELLYNLDDEQIRRAVQTEAAQIGYEVDQLIIFPEFEKKDGNQVFNISYQDYQLPSRVDGILLALSIHVESKIFNFGKAMQVLAPKESITHSMEKAIHNRLRHFLHGVDPERFYLRFNIGDASDKETLEEEIKKLISRLLTDRYDAVVSSITVNQLNTLLIARYKQLKEGSFLCEFQDKTGVHKYQAAINVLNIDPERWALFNAKGYKPRKEDPDDTERKDIANYISLYLENILNTALLPALRAGAIGDFTVLADRLEKDYYPTVSIAIKELFGLNIQIYTPVKIAIEKVVNTAIVDSRINNNIKQLAHEAALRDIADRGTQQQLSSLYAKLAEIDDEDPGSFNLTKAKILKEINEIEKKSATISAPINFEEFENKQIAESNPDKDSTTNKI